MTSGEQAEMRTFLAVYLHRFPRLLGQQGNDAAQAALHRLIAALRGTDGEFGGLLGDTAVLVFPSAEQAARAAVALVAGLAEEPVDHPSFPLDVGIGLAAGPALPLAQTVGYVALAQELARRLAAVAGPGEILVDSAVAQLVGDAEGLRFTDLPPMKINDFPETPPFFYLSEG